ncbi:MAG: hypothetical protein HYV28_12490 [Ignavibacteriales bacterium]|nr:hypothetical protein [Ignavibacteriales bacterium]
MACNTPFGFYKATMNRSFSNYLFHYVDGTLFVFAMSLVSLQTVIPVFVKELGGGMISVGLVPLLCGVGLNLPLLFFQPTMVL